MTYKQEKANTKQKKKVKLYVFPPKFFFVVIVVLLYSIRSLENQIKLSTNFLP